MTYKKFATDLAKQAGKTIRKNFALGMKKNWKSNNTPVTATDIAVNKMVIAAVTKNFPGHGVLGEEESYKTNGSKYLWVCDPVDGTIPFSYGVPICTFSLALVEDGRPIVGVVFDPFLDRLFYAEKGKGAYLNGKKISVNKSLLKNSALSWESWFTIGDLRKQTGAFSFCLLSYVYGAMMVACGEFTAALYNWDYAHDAAAVKIIVEEAGGKVTDMFGQEQRYDGKIRGCLASNGVVHQKLLEVIKKNRRQMQG